MTQATLDYSAPATKYERTREYFLARPNIWVSALELEQVGGRLSWRSRVSELRTIGGMNIQNKVRKVGGVLHSYYRWVP